MPQFENGQLLFFAILDDEQLTVASVAIAPTKATTFGTRRLLIQPIDQPIRVRAAGNPTSTRGIKVAAGDVLVWEADIHTLKFIRDSSATADATVEIHYFGVS